MLRVETRVVISLLLVAVVYWLFNFSIVTLGVLLDSGEWRFFFQRLGAYSLSAIPAWLTGVVIYSSFMTKHALRWPVFVLCFIFNALCHGALYALMYKYVIPLEYFEDMSPIPLALSVTLVNFTLAAVWQLVIVTWVMARRSVEDERRAARAENLAQSAQLEMLRYQLNPHFLFNTLNSISSLVVEKRTDDAEDMIMKLSAFLRRTLDTDPASLVPVHAELEAIERYLSIEVNRFSDRLTTRVEAAEDTRELLLPPLILQPLIENAIKHAVAPSSEAVHLEVSARIENNYLVIEVRDDGPGLGLGELKEGVGLGNIRMRLGLLFGADCDLHLMERDTGGTMATLIMPRIEAA